MANVGVLGAGSWGTALSVLLHDNGHEVTIWSIDQKEVEMLNTKREHEAKLPGVKLAKEVVITKLALIVWQVLKKNRNSLLFMNIISIFSLKMENML